MAMQTGIGLSRILILAGAGYTGTIMLKNGKLADLLGELQSLVKGLEKSGEQLDDSDALAAQVRRLSAEIRNMASARHITVLNGDSGGKLGSVIIPAAALGALGYGYMWWKGMNFSDLYWVTKRNMETAVANLVEHLDSVTDAVSKTKKYLIQRIQNLDDKMDVQKEISKGIMERLDETHTDFDNFKYDIDAVKRMVFGLDGRLGSLEYNQDINNAGIFYLCDKISGGKMPEALQRRLEHSVKSRNLLTSGAPTPKGLKDFVEILSGHVKDSGRYIIAPQDGIVNLDGDLRSLQRSNSAWC